MKSIFSVPGICSLILASSVLTGNVVAATPAPEGASVYIISPQDGDKVSSPLTVKFGLTGMGVAPAGVERQNTGHHHLLIDLATPPAMDAAIVADNQHRHFGGGQTEAVIELTPGQHTLQLLLGDQNHVPHQAPVLSQKITVQVKE